VDALIFVVHAVAAAAAVVGKTTRDKKNVTTAAVLITGHTFVRGWPLSARLVVLASPGVGRRTGGRGSCSAGGRHAGKGRQ
jgi:hypothetical protein